MGTAVQPTVQAATPSIQPPVTPTIISSGQSPAALPVLPSVQAAAIPIRDTSAPLQLSTASVQLSTASAQLDPSGITDQPRTTTETAVQLLG